MSSGPEAPVRIVIVGVVAVALVLAVVVWFAFGRGPFDRQGVQRPTDDGRSEPEQGYTGPAGPGAERQVPPSADA